MRLSVITIAYNNLQGLKKTLHLFEQERFADQVELVVVDGGSKDGTDAYLRQQTLTGKWVSEPDKGIYNAMNKGLAMAEGDYVWFLNSGDYAQNASVVKDILSALGSGPDALYGETMMTDAEGRELGTRSELSTRKLPEKLSWKSFRLGMNVGHQSFIIRRSLALPYDESLRFVADIDWMIRCLKQCRNIIRLDRVIACFTLDGFSTVNRKKSNLERNRVLRKHYGFIPNLLAHAMILMRKIADPGGL